MLLPSSLCQQLRHYFAFRKTPFLFSFPSFSSPSSEVGDEEKRFQLFVSQESQRLPRIGISGWPSLFFITSRGKIKWENWMWRGEDPEHQLTNVTQVRLQHALHTVYVRKHCSRLDVSHESSLIFPAIVSWIMSQMCSFNLSTGTHAHTWNQSEGG